MAASAPYYYSRSVAPPRRRSGWLWVVTLLAAGATAGAYRNDWLRDVFRSKGQEALYLRLEAATVGAPGSGTPRELEQMVAAHRLPELEGAREAAVPKAASAPSDAAEPAHGTPDDATASDDEASKAAPTTSLDDLPIEPTEAAAPEPTKAATPEPTEAAAQPKPVSRQEPARPAARPATKSSRTPPSTQSEARAVAPKRSAAAAKAAPPADTRPKTRKQQLDDAILKAMGQ